ncbi:MAG: hypothetical protein Fur0010_09090 [Bdellovibrio sp.]
MSISNTNATATQEPVVKITRNFRNTVEVESFYRFIHENDMRREARAILDHVYRKLLAARKKNKDLLQ